MAIRILSLFIFLTLLALTGIGVWNLYAGQLREEDHARGTAMISSTKKTLDMRELFIEYTALLGIHLNNLFDGRETLSTKQQLDTLIQKMGGVVESVGIKEDRETFVKIFESQVENYERYTIGLKGEDQKEMETAKQSLATNAQNFEKLSNSFLPSLPQGRGEELMNEHTAFMLAIVDAHKEKNTGKTLLLLRDASEQANLFATELINKSESKQQL